LPPRTDFVAWAAVTPSSGRSAHPACRRRWRLVAWLARLAGGTHPRVTGVDLVAEPARLGSERGRLRLASYGSSPRSRPLARGRSKPATRYRVRSPDLPAVPCLTAEELANHHAAIAAARPEVVLVALGCPRQERFAAEHFDAAPGAVWIGVGGTFDFYAGIKRRAPRLLQAVGAEWVARLAQDPGRLWRRYLLDDVPAFAAVSARVATDRLRHGPMEVSDAAALARRTPSGGALRATGQ
jgi:N-acetylglucosaminyldiphosphoundecaprenol N-acetyl-beta-D-mannosaminyltransferase